MKNKEKFAKEILDIFCNGDSVAMDKDRMKLQVCGGTECEDCYFCRANYPHNASNCERNFSHWANSEYKEKKEFSEADKAYVTAMDKLNWFVRDKNGDVWGFVNEPLKKRDYWHTDNTKFLLFQSFASSATFEPLSWEDEEPTHRNEILGVK